MNTTALADVHPDAERTPLHVPGLVRRVRRATDLSQRDLAARLGVSQATVARWEMGSAEPSLLLFQRLLGLARWGLAVVGEEGQPVEPMATDTCRDRGHRRFPAHLDVEDAVDPLTWERRPRARRRPHRDRRRRLAGGLAPGDHPTWEALEEARAAERARRRAASDERARLRPRQSLTVCRCTGACFLTAGCIPGCRCGCEAVSTVGSRLREPR
ncbi:MAG TPA: helix-turn-helix transcriptional regulator [Propionibacterium sp.]|nr:helix-turn-helix transcriptional regulator [Propionibacterium sp.]